MAEEDMEALEADKKYMLRNGAILLEKQIAFNHGKGTKSETLKVFSAKEIRHATKNFDPSLIVRRIVSTVYRGTLDGRTVAIKAARGLPPCKGVIESYLNHVTVKQLIHHKNVEKLHGCCLETQVTILVAEYMANSNLCYHLHVKEKAQPHLSNILWCDVLRIAMEISFALSYMHYALPQPIVHMDVKSRGVYLDESFTSKPSDFGFSLSLPPEEDFISHSVLGTPGYTDPEYQMTHRVTKKCDVYSLGVLLVEILTGKNPVEIFNSNVSLADCFVSSIEENNTMEIIHPGVIAEASRVEIESVAAIALKCLHGKGDERPSMREVATELRRIRRLSLSKQNNIAVSASAP